MGASKAEAKWMKRVRIRDLIEPTRAGQIPPVIFNATAVETGQRVLISPVQGYATRDGAPNDSDYERADVPIDFLRFYSRAAETPNDVNPRLTTAVRLSATFAYVTPVARPLPFDQVSSDANPHNEAARRRLELHLCDGGYSDNTGLVTAVRVVHDLITAYRQKVKDGIIEKPPFERVLFLRIEPFPPNATKIAKDNRGLKSALFGPLTALAATRTSTQAERADLELGLLMDVNKSELRNSQRSLARQLAILKETVQDAESELENEDYVSLKKQLYVLSEMSFDPESEPDRVTLNRQIAVVSNQVRRIQAPDNDTLKSISNVIEMYEDSRDQCESDNVSQIEIKTALFRFDTRPRVPAQLTQDSSVKQATSPNPVQQSKTEKSHNPPLSWRLAMSDVNAIEIAWQGYTKAIKNDGVASAAEDGATEPWQATEESQRDNTLLPHQLIELSAGE
jgi:DNA-binding transcriptional regulator YhcF (GntR family)